MVKYRRECNGGGVFCYLKTSVGNNNSLSIYSSILCPTTSPIGISTNQTDFGAYNHTLFRGQDRLALLRVITVDLSIPKATPR